MYFDVPKVVRSPGCDHGHDEESRNGRYIKIDILEAYVWTSETFRVKSAILPEYRGLPEPPGGLLGHSGPKERREEREEEVAARPTLLVRIGQGKGGGAPPFLPLLHFLLPPLLFQVGVLLPVGVGLPLGAPRTRPAASPLLLYIRGQGGTPRHTS